MVTREFVHRSILIAAVLIFHFKIGTYECASHLICKVTALSLNSDQFTTMCTRAPTIVGYFRHHGSLTMSYNITWKSAPCQDGSIIRYQIQFTENCSSTEPFNLFVDNHSTSTQIECASQDCYIRIRAELLDGLFSDFSTCVLMNNHIVENKSKYSDYINDISRIIIYYRSY